VIVTIISIPVLLLALVIALRRPGGASGRTRVGEPAEVVLLDGYRAARAVRGRFRAVSEPAPHRSAVSEPARREPA
jgi:hypothetical protein